MRSKKYKEQKIFADNNKYEGKGKHGKGFRNWKRWQKVTLIVVIIVAVAAVAGYAGFKAYLNYKLDKVKKTTLDTKKLSCVDVNGYVNIALLGVDSRSMSSKNLKGTNTDCIIIVSMNTKTKKVNLISVYRDTYTKIGETSTYSKINSAYASGGAETALKTINQTMDLNVSKYVLFNFKMVSDLVNDVGGITVDVKDYEIQQLNKYTKQTAHNIGQKKYKLVKKAGKQTLEGVQAVSYGRIRKGVGDDFKRTSRMRIVIKKVTNKLKDKSIFKMIDIMDDCLPQCQTNLSNNDMIGLAQRLSKLEFNKSVGFPYNVTTGLMNGISYVFPDDLSANVVKLHKELFGQKDYTASSTVNAISATIAANKSGAYNSSSGTSTKSNYSSGTSSNTTKKSTGTSSGTSSSGGSSSGGSSSGGSSSGGSSGGTSSGGGSSGGSSGGTSGGSSGGTSGGSTGGDTGGTPSGQ
jgi:LCP family protein required for cell wall assembly